MLCHTDSWPGLLVGQDGTVKYQPRLTTLPVTVWEFGMFWDSHNAGQLGACGKSQVLQHHCSSQLASLEKWHSQGSGKGLAAGCNHCAASPFTAKNGKKEGGLRLLEGEGRRSLSAGTTSFPIFSFLFASFLFSVPLHTCSPLELLYSSCWLMAALSYCVLSAKALNKVFLKKHNSYTSLLILLCFPQIHIQTEQTQHQDSHHSWSVYY